MQVQEEFIRKVSLISLSQHYRIHIYIHIYVVEDRSFYLSYNLLLRSALAAVKIRTASSLQYLAFQPFFFHVCLIFAKKLRMAQFVHTQRGSFLF